MSRPKRRRLVISDYIQACLDEETLLDEEGELELNGFTTQILIFWIRICALIK